ncbi:MAG: type II toxin-antitoxin system VapC family toxin [Acidobacteria bacterium]|nr:type II toxin-antitoxin system VapC family toxin [Acidobacteriota bacterium]MYD72700.1 type II toxin-antitoxin system VapC family toxin [Acidobacteriota bacterium]MYJ02976.1 type II toxin-antitoxin system VapC family toxin [Acidobacteriota bacterium]
MPPVVVDASVLVAAVVDTGPDGDWARSVTSEGPLIAPELAPVEAGNVLRRAELARSVSGAEATAAYRDIVDLPIELLRFAPFAARIWELRSNLTTYDAWYVACAEALAVPLATLDARLARAPGLSCRFLLPDSGSASSGEPR